MCKLRRRWEYNDQLDQADHQGEAESSVHAHRATSNSPEAWDGAPWRGARHGWGSSAGWREGKPPWMHKRRFLFRRFAASLGLALLTLMLGMGGMAYLLTRMFGGGGETAAAVWLASCGLGLALPLLAGAFAVRSFRRLADPLAQVMAAADAVAEGDLTVRVPDRGPGEMGRLAHSFNRMVAEIQSSDQRRRDMTADVAHELRTPLHILQGNLEGILDGVYQPTSEQIELLLDETHRLSRLVEDLRTLSLAEAGQLSLELLPVNLEELLSDAVVTFSGPAEAAGVELRLEIEPRSEGSAPVTIPGDAGRLDQAIGNLLANAIQHTPSGGRVKLHLNALPDHAARIQVSDTGNGIPAEDLEFIFDRFWRGRTSTEGSGLGLAIARRLIEAHGGSIRADSTPGVGTIFTVEL